MLSWRRARGASASALHAGCAKDAQFGCAVGVLFEEVVLQVEQRFFAECLGEGVGAERVGLFGIIQHEARALYRCGGEVDDAAHAGALGGDGDHGGKQAFARRAGADPACWVLRGLLR